MDVLILSSPQDVHYRAVDWALRKIGMESRLLFGNCFPQHDAQTLILGDDELHYEARLQGGDAIDLLAARVVWYRRGHWPVIAPELSEADQEAARREAEMFVGGARSVSALHQRWINKPDRELAANRKPYQLHVAKRVGMTIPRTLMSNDPERIRDFFANADCEIVLKPFRAMQWVNADEHLILFANKLRFEDIRDPSALSLTSQIFQEYVEKAYELRVFFLGGRMVPIKLDSQLRDVTKTDWRTSTDGSLSPELYKRLPDKVRGSISRYMEHMGLEYGAFDFIVRPDGEYVFLECNVSGQFLFVEEWNPEIRILSEFVRFLTAGLDLTPQQHGAIDSLRYLDFFHSAETAAYYDALGAEYPRAHMSQNLHHEASAP